MIYILFVHGLPGCPYHLMPSARQGSFTFETVTIIFVITIHMKHNAGECILIFVSYWFVIPLKWHRQKAICCR